MQKQVLDLLQSIRRRDDIALLLISHDVSVVAEICDRVLVMYAGRIVEDLPAAELANGASTRTPARCSPRCPTWTPTSSSPLATVPGRAADPSKLPAGCAYAARCPLADDHCRTVDPDLVEDAAGRRVACWHAGDVVTLGIPLIRDVVDVEDVDVDVEEVTA